MAQSDHMVTGYVMALKLCRREAPRFQKTNVLERVHRCGVV
jgi:hypothetical protein